MSKAPRRVLKANPGDSNFVLLEGGNSILASGPNAVGVTRDNGVFINGPVSFSSSIDSIKFGGIFRFNPILGSGLPSTMITPIPTLTIEAPIKGITNMASVTGILGSLVV